MSLVPTMLITRLDCLLKLILTRFVVSVIDGGGGDNITVFVSIQNDEAYCYKIGERN